MKCTEICGNQKHFRRDLAFCNARPSSLAQRLPSIFFHRSIVKYANDVQQSIEVNMHDRQFPQNRNSRSIACQDISFRSRHSFLLKEMFFRLSNLSRLANKIAFMLSYGKFRNTASHNFYEHRFIDSLQNIKE